MAEPITWRNVTSPSMPADAARPMAYGAQTINQGFDQLQQVLSGITANDNANWQNQKVNNTQAFLDRLAGYKTPDQLAAAQAAGELTEMREGFGAQVDRAAIRSAEENRIGQLRVALTQEQTFGKDQAALAHEPLAAQMKAALLNDDTATFNQMAGNFPNMPQLPQLLEAKVNRERQRTADTRASTEFGWKEADRPLVTQELQGRINNAKTTADTNKIQAQTAQIVAKAREAEIDANKAKARVANFEKEFKASIKAKEEEFTKSNLFGEGSITQDRNVDKLNDFINANIKDKDEASRIRAVLLKPRTTELVDPETKETKKLEGIPLALAKRLILDSASTSRLWNNDDTIFSTRATRLEEALNTGLKDAGVARDYKQAMEMAANRADGYKKLKESLFPSLPNTYNPDPTLSPLFGDEEAAAQKKSPVNKNTRETVAAFTSQVEPAAQRVAAQLGVPVDAVIGQWGLETGWGKSVIPGTNNFGNIKDFSGGGVAAKDNMLGTVDKYRKYADLDGFAADFTNLLGNRRYAAVKGAKDPNSYFSGLKNGGYAEDPNYVSSGVRAASMVAQARGIKPVVKSLAPASALAVSNTKDDDDEDDNKVGEDDD